MNLSRKLIPDVDTLQAFESAARHESFTQAARELSLTQSAISRQIKHLEVQVGARLFERVRQRVVLSEAGRRFLPEVRQILRQTEDLMMRTMAASQSSSSLSVATLPTFGTKWLLPRLPEFLAGHPGTAINVGSRSRPFDFSEQPFDAAVHYGSPTWAHATCVFLCREIIVPVASPELAARVRRSVTGDVAALPLLHVATRPKAWSRWFETVGVVADTPYKGHRFDLFTMVIEAATAGLGAALLPLYLIEKELETGVLEVVHDHRMVADTSYYLAIPDEKKDSPIVRQFSDWIVSATRKQPNGWAW